MPTQEEITRLTSDPVGQLLLSGRAETLREAEELYLDACLPEVISLLDSELSDEELGRHPLMRMLRSHGSRAWEEATD
jgi:chorismate-pyruvate lyase